MLITEYNTQTEEWVALLRMIYENDTGDGVPDLLCLYKEFQNDWIKMTSEFLMTNKDAWELADEELTDVEERLDNLGFHCPTIEQIQEVLLLDEMSHRTADGSFSKMAVKAVW